NIKGVNNSGTNIKGVNNSTNNIKGVDNSGSNIKGVNISTNKQHPLDFSDEHVFEILFFPLYDCNILNILIFIYGIDRIRNIGILMLFNKYKYKYKDIMRCVRSVLEDKREILMYCYNFKEFIGREVSVSMFREGYKYEVCKWYKDSVWDDEGVWDIGSDRMGKHGLDKRVGNMAPLNNRIGNMGPLNNSIGNKTHLGNNRGNSTPLGNNAVNNTPLGNNTVNNTHLNNNSINNTPLNNNLINNTPLKINLLDYVLFRESKYSLVDIECRGVLVREEIIITFNYNNTLSAWKENIESKISKLVLSKDLLEKARKQEKLSTSETKSLKKIMREFNLNLSSVTDLSEALVKKNESLNVYEKKITMHESRKQFRKENRMFELFRGRFYRGLSERVESEHVVSRDEIVSFWSTMWNKNDDTVTYDDYLIPF
ncbi:hypothetical protein CWI38_2704p0010, partial [Hamiltosporidium tvaerminnensis]